MSRSPTSAAFHVQPAEAQPEQRGDLLEQRSVAWHTPHHSAPCANHPDVIWASGLVLRKVKYPEETWRAQNWKDERLQNFCSLYQRLNQPAYVMSVGASGVARSTCHWRRRNVFVLSLGLIGPEGLWQPVPDVMARKQSIF
jgi:hypothetical protein